MVVLPDVVLVNGSEELHPEGAHYLEWREGSKRVGLSVGKDAQDAAARRLRKEAELNAVNKGVAVVSENGNGKFGYLLEPWPSILRKSSSARSRRRTRPRARLWCTSLNPAKR